MEIDEFKEMFNKNVNASTVVNKNIMTMIYADSNSPLTALEKKLRITLYIFPVVTILFSGRFFFQEAKHHGPTSWLLFGILSLEFLVSLLNYMVTRSLRRAEGPVKQNLIAKLTLLQKRYKWYFAAHNCLILLIAVLLEITIHYHWDSNFEGWSHVNILLRIVVYIILFITQFIIKYRSQKDHYGQYIEKLQVLSGQMQ